MTNNYINNTFDFFGLRHGIVVSMAKLAPVVHTESVQLSGLREDGSVSVSTAHLFDGVHFEVVLLRDDVHLVFGLAKRESCSSIW